MVIRFYDFIYILMSMNVFKVLGFNDFKFDLDDFKKLKN